jgi:hypothetical protein
MQLHRQLASLERGFSRIVVRPMRLRQVGAQAAAASCWGAAGRDAGSAALFVLPKRAYGVET